MKDRKLKRYEIERSKLEEIYNATIAEGHYSAESAFNFDNPTLSKEYDAKAVAEREKIERLLFECSKNDLVFSWLINKALQLASCVYFGGFCRIVEELGFEVKE